MKDTPDVESRLIVGFEIHVHLATRTKLFCGCELVYSGDPNHQVCPVCLGLPGALPVLNRRAVELAATVGLALNCRVGGRTQWDRKSYFYPDLPKNYQISQYDFPLASEGRFEFAFDGAVRRVGIIRAHLEEDAGKNVHAGGAANGSPGSASGVAPGAGTGGAGTGGVAGGGLSADASGGGTLVDLNRAGTPLLEIVTEPDIESAEEAHAFCVELHRLVTYLGVTEGNMQLGQMRFEPNVNLAIRCDGRDHRTPITEIKNLNSFRSVRLAIEYERARQLGQWLADRNYVQGTCPNENRGWDDDREVTVHQRGKELAEDYRYFPDPDLVPVAVDDAWVARIRTAMPELPLARRRRLMEGHGLSAQEAEVVVANRETAELFDAAVSAGAPADVLAKQFGNVWSRLAKGRDVTIGRLGLSPARIGQLASMVGGRRIGSSAADEVAGRMLDDPSDPEAIAESLGLMSVHDDAQVAGWVDEAFSANERAVRDAVADAKKAKAAAGFLRGQVMKLSGGRADGKMVGALIEAKLAALRKEPESKEEAVDD